MDLVKPCIKVGEQQEYKQMRCPEKKIENIFDFRVCKFAAKRK